MNIPKQLSHTPIIGVDYESKDASAGDAKYLSLGRATFSDYQTKKLNKKNGPARVKSFLFGECWI